MSETQDGNRKQVERIELPEVLDVLIVGGGPAGTAAAFRAKELGLSALVIERDVLLSTLRDWMSEDANPAKDKKVDASYGPAGKNVPFPVGEELVQELAFGDRVPAGELYRRWTKVYREKGIPAREEIELTNLVVGRNNTWEAVCYNTRTNKEENFCARTVVLAMGRGVPTRLDIPGDLTGIHYGIRSVDRFVTGPVAVIGGGTSAAEAVIEISNAKVQSGDVSDVYWSYRRKSLPKVNSTLSQEFFNAYNLNGNIKYLPCSEPIAVLADCGGHEFLALRSDRREMSPSRPPEATYLEFPKERVVACIGGALPLDFLESVGIRRLKTEDEEHLMAATPFLESRCPNVFLVGDLLAPAYIPTMDFDSDKPHAERRHVGNFKQNMTDGVLAIEAIHLRLKGYEDEEIHKYVDGLRLEYENAHKERLEQVEMDTQEETEDAPEPRVGARFVCAANQNGERERREYLFVPGKITIGREQGEFTFPEDEGVVDNHAAILVEPDGCYLSTEGMQGDCYVAISGERTLQVGDVFYAGKQILSIESKGDTLLLAVKDPEGNTKRWLPVSEETVFYGRQAKDGISIDPLDDTLSRRHFTLSAQGGGVVLKDPGSMNYTYLKVNKTIRLKEGEVILFGPNPRYILKFVEYESGGDPVAVVEETVAINQPSLVETLGESKLFEGELDEYDPDDVPLVYIENFEEAVKPVEDVTVLETLKQLGMATTEKSEIGGKCQTLYRCESADCGLCIVQVLDGMDNLFDIAKKGKVKRTLEGQIEDLQLDESVDYKLACSVKAQGPVTLKLLGDTDV